MKIWVDADACPVVIKEILFRADGNSEIGLGHLYRLFSLIEMLKEHFKFTFVSSENSTVNIIPNSYQV